MKPLVIKLIIVLNLIIILVFVTIMINKIKHKNNENKGYVDTSHYGSTVQSSTTIEKDTITIDGYTFIGDNIIVLDPNGNEIEFDNDGNSISNE